MPLAKVAIGRPLGSFDLYYEVHGTGESKVLLIMGWGCVGAMWKIQVPSSIPRYLLFI